MKIKLLIAGSRNFTDYDFLKSCIKSLIDSILLLDIDAEIEIISGTARGTDKLGERYAMENNIPLKQFPANWEEYGKKAGILRNEEMAKYITHALIFWEGESKGTKNMIDLCLQYKIPYFVVNYKEGKILAKEKY